MPIYLGCLGFAITPQAFARLCTFNVVLAFSMSSSAHKYMSSLRWGSWDGMTQADASPPPPPPSSRETKAEREERLRREEIRKERAKERERERRLEAKDAHGFKRSKTTRDRDRDVSEKMALGQVLCCPSRPLLGKTQNWAPFSRKGLR